MKVCRKCKVKKDEMDFNKNKTSRDGLQRWCRPCQRAAVASHYTQNRARLSAKHSQLKSLRRDALKLKIQEYFATHPCVDCGESDPVVLEFDHVREEKQFTISNRAYRVVPPWQKLLEEIAKCDVRCANCHRRKTAMQLGWHTNRLSDAVEL